MLLWSLDGREYDWVWWRVTTSTAQSFQIISSMAVWWVLSSCFSPCTHIHKTHDFTRLKVNGRTTYLAFFVHRNTKRTYNQSRNENTPPLSILLIVPSKQGKYANVLTNDFCVLINSSFIQFLRINILNIVLKIYKLSMFLIIWLLLLV